MNTVSHPVAPEDIMAFLDGELPTSVAQSVSAHLADCEECARVAAEFRDTALLLSRWTVPALPPEMKSTIEELAADVAYNHKKAGGKSPLSGGSWTWKPWAAIAAGAAALALLVVTFFAPLFERPHIAPYISASRQAERVSASNPEVMDTSRLVETRREAMVRGDIDPGALALKSSDSLPKWSSSVDSLNSSVKASLIAPMIAHTVNLTIVASDFAASRSVLDNILARHHGYFAQLNVSTQEGAPRSLQGSLRIPSSDLLSALADLKTLGRVQSESQSGEEVTQQHEDLADRLKTARETEDRLRGILEQRTGKLADVLAVEQEIARVRGEIERMEAEQKAIEHRVDFATVEIQLTEDYRAKLNLPNSSVSTRLDNAFVAGYHNAAETILGIVLFVEEYGPEVLIWLIILALPVIAWRRYWRLRSRFR